MYKTGIGGVFLLKWYIDLVLFYFEKKTFVETAVFANLCVKFRTVNELCTISNRYL